MQKEFRYYLCPMVGSSFLEFRAIRTAVLRRQRELVLLLWFGTDLFPCFGLDTEFTCDMFRNVILEVKSIQIEVKKIKEQMRETGFFTDEN